MNLLEEQQYKYHPRDQGPVFLDVHLNVYIHWKLSVRLRPHKVRMLPVSVTVTRKVCNMQGHQGR